MGDRRGLAGPPLVDPPGWWRTSLRLPRDHYVRLDTNDYSIHPLAIGRRIEVKADLDQVLAFCEGTEVARHARCWARHQSLTDPSHAAAAKAGRERARQQPAAARQLDVEQRPLDTYDRIFGVIDGVVSPPHHDPDLSNPNHRRSRYPPPFTSLSVTSIRPHGEFMRRGLSPEVFGL
ncbi:Mu transposase domain-containing protein [Streptomyces sp. CA-106110]|uniref:Mu transposase domain-containing protein n=1 Tax=Streptomyces sp. CA-106110 TaxID=3240044 RepID=UPI003D90FE25